jgi:hypothetical protein
LGDVTLTIHKYFIHRVAERTSLRKGEGEGGEEKRGKKRERERERSDMQKKTGNR